MGSNPTWGMDIYRFVNFGCCKVQEMNLEEVGRGCGDWMELAQDRDRWRAFVSTVMNFGVP